MKSLRMRTRQSRVKVQSGTALDLSQNVRRSIHKIALFLRIASGFMPSWKFRLEIDYPRIAI
jgi:hypothetical protein